MRTYCEPGYLPLGGYFSIQGLLIKMAKMGTFENATHLIVGG